MKVDHDGCGASSLAPFATSLLVLLTGIAPIYPLGGVADEFQNGIDRIWQLPAMKRLGRTCQYPRSLTARTMWPPILSSGVAR
jgi:hypothetical protein